MKYFNFESRDSLMFTYSVKPIQQCSFTHTVNVTVLISGIFDLFDGMCKQRHMIALNPF